MVVNPPEQDKHKWIFDKAVKEVLDALDAGTVPWRQPWSVAGAAARMSPRNPLSGATYTGGNRFILYITMMIRGYKLPFFGTFHQIKEAGYTISKGAKAVNLVRFNPKWETMEQTAKRLRVSDLSEAEYKARREVAYVVPFGFQVFALEQTDMPREALPAFEDESDFEPIAECERIVASYPHDYRIGEKASYHPAGDYIEMPPAETFVSPADYYATYYHEMVHSTGHPDRCKRVFGKVKGDETYAFEELIAEFGAAMLCATSGIDSPALVDQHAAYCKSWSQYIKKHPRMFMQAASRAEEATRFIMSETENMEAIEAEGEAVS